MNLAVDISRDIELLGRLKHRLETLGMRAEVREHLLSLVVFPPAPALPVCVFVCGHFYSWDGGQKQLPVIDVTRAAEELAAVAVRRPRRQSPDGGSSER